MKTISGNGRILNLELNLPTNYTFKDVSGVWCEGTKLNPDDVYAGEAIWVWPVVQAQNSSSSPSTSSGIKPFLITATPTITGDQYLAASDSWIFQGVSDVNSLYGNFGVYLYRTGQYSSNGQEVSQTLNFTIKHNNALNGFTTNTLMRYQHAIFEYYQRGYVTLLINEITTSQIKGKVIYRLTYDFSSVQNGIPTSSFVFPLTSIKS